MRLALAQLEGLKKLAMAPRASNSEASYQRCKVLTTGSSRAPNEAGNTYLRVTLNACNVRSSKVAVRISLQRGCAHPCVNVGGDVLDVGDDTGEHRVEGVVDGREDLAAAEYARGAALRHKDAVRRQLWLHHCSVEVLGVQLRTHTTPQSATAGTRWNC